MQPPTIRSTPVLIGCWLAYFCFWAASEVLADRLDQPTAQPIELPAHTYEYHYPPAYVGRPDGWKRICPDGWNWSGMRGECVDNRRSTVATR